MTQIDFAQKSTVVLDGILQGLFEEPKGATRQMVVNCLAQLYVDAVVVGYARRPRPLTLIDAKKGILLAMAKRPPSTIAKVFLGIEHHSWCRAQRDAGEPIWGIRVILGIARAGSTLPDDIAAAWDARPIEATRIPYRPIVDDGYLEVYAAVFGAALDDVIAKTGFDDVAPGALGQVLSPAVHEELAGWGWPVRVPPPPLCSGVVDGRLIVMFDRRFAPLQWRGGTSSVGVFAEAALTLRGRPPKGWTADAWAAKIDAHRGPTIAEYHHHRQRLVDGFRRGAGASHVG